MPKRSAKASSAKLRPDVAETAFRVMQEAIGEAPKTLPPSERTEKNPETTPAMAAGLTDHVWTVEEVLERMDPNHPLHSN